MQHFLSSGSAISQAEWRVEPSLVPYPDAMRIMEERVEAIGRGDAPELFWLLEHPPLYTAGTSAHASDLIDAGGFPVYATGRGGQYTYHGPGQRVVYALCDLRARGRDLRAHVWRLEELIIRVLAGFGVRGERREGRVGIWVVNKYGAEEKIAAIGVRVRRWITWHGLSLNVRPDLRHFKGIVPCGLPQFGVTSLETLGVEVSIGDVDAAFSCAARDVFRIDDAP
ncbi:MAG: lipoyl(octanoyl) transferase LipB [Bdellovibrionales bacterium]